MSREPHGTPIYRTDEIRRIEALAAAHIEPPPLMERAGLAAAALAKEIAIGGKRVCVLAGPGNNGGDAFVVARCLKAAWFKVDVLFTGVEEKLSADAAAALAAWRAAGGRLSSELPPSADCGLVVDGLFGIGLQRELTGQYAKLVQWANEAKCPVLALDVPSGIESDSGRMLGVAVRATHTITFIGVKPGLLTLDGVDHCGELHVAALGIDAAGFAEPHGRVVAGAVLAQLPSRRRNTHKGDYGSVGVIGGASGMIGAALLAARAALKLGSGRVYVGFAAQDAPAVDFVQPELMLRRADEVLLLEHLTCLAVGPGLGSSSQAETLLARALALPLPLVLDADALNLVSQRDTFQHTLRARTAATVLTPHPAEAARLLGASTREIQLDRVASAGALAAKYGCAAVLKGAGTVCAWPDGRWAINTSGNPGLASGGTGDVLTGMLAALLGAGVSPELALECAVHLHGAAADRLVQEGVGPAGLAASELIDAARRIVNAAA